MAENLLKAGYPVTGHTLEPDKLDRLAAAGGTPATSIAEAVREADVIITMVPASPQVEAIAYGPDGILANARRGALLIDMSSITPQTSIDLAAAAAERGLRVLDAPVSGGEAGAIEAVLSIMVGGPQEDFDAARPLFEALGTTIVRCGPHGAGQTVKAANQLIVAVNLQACACPSAPWSPPWSPPCAHRAAASNASPAPPPFDGLPGHRRSRRPGRVHRHRRRSPPALWRPAPVVVAPRGAVRGVRRERAARPPSTGHDRRTRGPERPGPPGHHGRHPRPRTRTAACHRCVGVRGAARGAVRAGRGRARCPPAAGGRWS